MKQKKIKKETPDIPGISGNSEHLGYGMRDGTTLTVSRKQTRRLVEAYDILPLDFWLENLNDPESSMATKNECAKNAAPYVHRKMPVSIDDDSGNPMSFITPEMIAKLTNDELKAFQSIMLKISKLMKAQEET